MGAVVQGSATTALTWLPHSRLLPAAEIHLHLQPSRAPAFSKMWCREIRAGVDNLCGLGSLVHTPVAAVLTSARQPNSRHRLVNKTGPCPREFQDQQPLHQNRSAKQYLYVNALRLRYLAQSATTHPQLLKRESFRHLSRLNLHYWHLR